MVSKAGVDLTSVQSREIIQPNIGALHYCDESPFRLPRLYATVWHQAHEGIKSSSLQVFPMELGTIVLARKDTYLRLIF